MGNKTTICISVENQRALALLKMELKRRSYNQVVSELINDYRLAHGWSAISLADQLKELGVKDLEVIKDG